MSDEQPALPDDSGPTPERQAELRAAYEANMAAGKAPYTDVRISTRGELRWVMEERRWSGATSLSGAYEHANLSRAAFSGANLSGTSLQYANLSGAAFNYATLSKVDLSGADLSRVVFFGANLSGAYLISANLSGADLGGANLSGAILRIARMDATTKLLDVHLNDDTFVADVVWNGVPLTRLNWEDVSVLGEERAAWQPKDGDGKRKGKARRLREFADAVLASRQVATVLRSQGLNEHADRFAYRAQLLQRQVLRRQRHYLRWLGSLFLWGIAGYGYRPLRSVLSYLLVVAAFGALYFTLGGVHGQALSWNEALVVSLTAFHGRGFFATAFQPGDPQCVVVCVGIGWVVAREPRFELRLVAEKLPVLVRAPHAVAAGERFDAGRIQALRAVRLGREHQPRWAQISEVKRLVVAITRAGEAAEVHLARHRMWHEC
jgi:hypothetical protein